MARFPNGVLHQQPRLQSGLQQRALTCRDFVTEWCVWVKVGVKQKKLNFGSVQLFKREKSLKQKKSHFRVDSQPRKSDCMCWNHHPESSRARSHWSSSTTTTTTNLHTAVCSETPTWTHLKPAALNLQCIHTDPESVSLNSSQSSSLKSATLPTSAHAPHLKE